MSKLEDEAAECRRRADAAFARGSKALGDFYHEQARIKESYARDPVHKAIYDNQELFSRHGFVIAKDDGSYGRLVFRADVTSEAIEALAQALRDLEDPNLIVTRRQAACAKCGEANDLEGGSATHCALCVENMADPLSGEM